MQAHSFTVTAIGLSTHPPGALPDENVPGLTVAEKGIKASKVTKRHKRGR